MNQLNFNSDDQSKGSESNKLSKALFFLKQGELFEAESIYRGLIKENSKNHIVYSNLAVIKFHESIKNNRISKLSLSLLL